MIPIYIIILLLTSISLLFSCIHLWSDFDRFIYRLHHLQTWFEGFNQWFWTLFTPLCSYALVILSPEMDMNTWYKAKTRKICSLRVVNLDMKSNNAEHLNFYMFIFSARLYNDQTKYILSIVMKCWHMFMLQVPDEDKMTHNSMFRRKDEESVG